MEHNKVITENDVHWIVEELKNVREIVINMERLGGALGLLPAQIEQIMSRDRLDGISNYNVLSRILTTWICSCIDTKHRTLQKFVEILRGMEFNSAADTIFQISKNQNSIPLNYSQINLKNNIDSNTNSTNSTFLNFWNVPNRNTNFIGRNEIFEQINSNFNGNEIHAVITACYGLGGNGKTSIALEYAWRFGHKFSKVYWFDAQNHHRLLTEYITLGLEEKILRPEECNSENYHRIAGGKIKRWFELSTTTSNKSPRSHSHSHHHHKGWLLIYDNSPNYNDIIDILPVQGGKILVTSRFTEWPQKIIPLDVFSPIECKEYISKILNSIIPTSIEEIEKFSTCFKYHPLAIAQATAYIRMCRILISDYLKIYSKKQNELLNKNILYNTNSIFLTWDITMEIIKKQMPLAAMWIEILSCFDSDDIPHEFLHIFIRLRNKNEMYSDVLGTLNKYSMINVNVYKNNSSIHRLVQEVISLKSNTHHNRLKIIVLGFLILNSSYTFVYCNEIEARQNQDRLIPHIEAVLNFLQNQNYNWIEIPKHILFEDLYEIKLLQIESKYYIKSNKKFKIDIDFFKKRLLLMQDYKQIEPPQRHELFCKSVLMLEIYFGKNVSSLANCLSEVCHSATSQHEFIKSIQYIEKAYNIYNVILQIEEEKINGIFNFIGTMWNTGAILLQDGLDVKKGFDLIQKAFKLYKRYLTTPNFIKGELTFAAIFSMKAYKEILNSYSEHEEQIHVLDKYFKDSKGIIKLSSKYQKGKKNYRENKIFLNKINELLLNNMDLFIVVETIVTFGNSKMSDSNELLEKNSNELLEKILTGFHNKTETINQEFPCFLDTCHSTRYSPLMLCSLYKNLESAKILLKFGASINYQNLNGTTALSLAVYYGYYEGVEFLLNNGADMMLRDQNLSVLHLAAGGSQVHELKILTLILEKLIQLCQDDSNNEEFSKEINAGDMDGDTALMYAVALSENVDFVTTLLKYNDAIEINKQNNYGKTALSWAIEKNNIEMIYILVVKYNADCSFISDQEIMSIQNLKSDVGSKYIQEILNNITKSIQIKL